MSQREFDPEEYGWDWDILPSDILIENNRGTYFNIQHSDGFCARNTIALFIDGACPGNGQPWARGAWGVYFGSDSRLNGCDLLDDDEPQTSQRAELTAAIQALVSIRGLNGQHRNMRHFIIVCDSAYVVNGISDYIERWKGNGWKNSAGRTVANQDLWKELDDLCYDHEKYIGTVVFWRVDRDENEEADALARSALE